MRKLLHLYFMLFTVVAIGQQSKIVKIPLTEIPPTQKTASITSILSEKMQTTVLGKNIRSNTQTEFRLVNTKTDRKGHVHKTYQQYYNGIKVIHGIIKMHEKNGSKESFNGVYFDAEGIKTTINISTTQIENIAKNYIGSNDVFWIGDNDFSKKVVPEPELLILPNRKDETMRLAYAIGIGTSTPELKMGRVYIDAQTGSVIKYTSLIRSCFDSNHADAPHNHTGNMNVPLVSGVGETVYSGSKTIETTLDTDYVLYDQTRASTGQGHNHGAGTRNGIVTVNFNNHDVLNDYNSAFVTDFTDNDNNWTAGEMSANEDQYALDAHWGAQLVYDYWKNEHGRDSYDGNDASIVSYVHFDTDYTNAAWISFNNQRGFMVYGDGAGSFTPLTNLDVVGHEIGHGITNANSNLDYELESGALNEGMSDIWAAAIDMYATTNHGTTKSPWLINDENGGGTFRSMSNPNAYGQPDTYGGTFWYDVVGCTPDGTNNDYCGVHTNSGVLNYWFYLITEGGSGTNDNADSYSVSAIGIDKSAAIAYRMESVYLTSTSDYEDARAASIQATKDLYGNCSNEEEAVTNAWYAVGVGAVYSGQTPVVTVDNSNLNICVGGTGTFYAEADYANSMVWQNDVGGSWVDLSNDTTYSGVTTNTLTVTNPDISLDGVRYRLQFSNDCGATSTTNNRYLYVKTLPDVTSVVPNGAGCTSTTDGSLTVNFNNVAGLNNIEFSIDGGATYPYNYADTSGSQTISDLAAGDYNVWVRRGGDECPIEVGTYTVASIPTVTATVDAIIEADIAEINGIIQVSFPDEATQTQIKFSIDGGISYGYVFNDNTGTAELTDLAADTYEVWATYGDELCAKRIGNFTVNEMAYTQIPDANFEAALYNLGYDNYLGDDKVPTSLINTVTSLNIRLENITDLTGIEDFTVLEELYADNNDLTTVDVSSNTALKELIVYNNANLSSFTVADPSIITRITLSDCNLSGDYDFSTYTSLTSFSVQNNNLTGLNVKNGNNTNFTYFDARGNSSLTCILVDDAAWSTTNWTQNGGATYSSTFCEYTAIPDANFEAALEALGYDDISNDGQVPTPLIEVVTGLDVSSQSISDITGIAGFTALVDLDVNDNTLTSLDLSNNENLETVNFDNNDVATLSLGTNTILSEVSGRYNQLTTVSVSANTGLTNLNLRNNSFSTVDVSANTSLTTLNLNQTGITSLDVTNNPDLAYLYLSGNSLTSIDVSQNPLLENINLTDSDLTTIDLSNQTVLRVVRLSGNNLTELDLTTNVALTQVECADNELSSFNFKNGFNQIITDFDASGNTNLSCVLVDDLNKDYTFWIKDATTIFSDTYCRYTAIPDANFEAALENLAYDDISGDGQVPTALIEVVTDLNVDSESISDLTGIEDFTALTSLSCFDNALTTIDLSNNLNLESLMLKENLLSTVNVLNNTELVSLRISDNNLTTLDVSNNVNLSTLRCDTNNLTALDVSNNTQLVNLDVYNMATLTSLNIDSNTILQSLKANNTGITAIDFSNNPLLRLAYLHQTSIADVDFSQNPLIEELRLQNTQITTLDLSLQTALTNLNCSQNSLSYLNVKNGNNTAITDFDASSNTNLSCIVVDDLDNDYSTWTKDVTASYSDTYCRYTAIPDANFEAELEALGYDDISGDGQVPTELIEVVTELNVSSENISDLTGIEDFVALIVLKCHTNNITALDFTSNLNLQELRCHLNPLVSLNVSNNTQLNFLSCRDANLTVLDVTNNPALETLKVYGTDLTTLDLSNNPMLNQLAAYSTKITAFDFSNNPLLRILEIHNNAITSIDFSNNPLIEELRIDQTRIEDLDLSIQTNLTYLRCFQAKLHNLNLQNGNNTNVTRFDAWSNPNLTCILVDDAAYSSSNTIWTDNIDSGVTFNDGTYCRYTAIPDANFESRLDALGYDDISGDNQVPTVLIESVTNLDISYGFVDITDLTGLEDFTALETLDVSGHNFVTMDLSHNLQLVDLRTNNNYDLTNLDVSNNTLLKSLACNGSNFTSLDVTNNTALEYLGLSHNTNLTSIDVSQNLNLETLGFSDVNFTSLDVTNNALLTKLLVIDVPITDLDLSNNAALEEIEISQTSLSFLNLKNGTNTIITDFYSNQNPNLTCILVDDATFSSTNWTNVNATASFSDTYCRYTAIPDANFEAALEVLGYDDISGDGQVPTALIEVVTSLDISDKTISDVTGIEDFTSLTSLNIEDNSLTSLDISNIVTLEFLFAKDNEITSIDFSQNVALTRIDIRNNPISVLDVSSNNLITRIECNGTNITAFDVTNLTQLDYFDANNLSLTTIDLSQNIVLRSLRLMNTTLTSIDVSANPNLETLWINGSPISSLDLTNNISLKSLRTWETNITELDLTNQPSLVGFFGHNGLLETLNLRNGNNSAIPNGGFSASGNPNLTCILVDDATYSSATWSNVDATTSFSDTYCRYTAIPDANFEAALEALGYDDISSDGQVPTALIEVVTSLNVSNKGIIDLTGIEDFIALENLYIVNNSFTSLDFSTNLNLKILDVSDNANLTSMNVTNNTALEEVFASNCGFTTVDFSNNTALKIVTIFDNNLTTLDLSNNVNLESILCQNNDIVGLDLSSNAALRYIDVSNNMLTSLNVKNGNNSNVTVFNALNNSELSCVLVDNAAYSTTNWSLGIDGTASFNEVSCGVIVAAKVFLQGAMINPIAGEETLMRDDLRTEGGLYGPTSPYGDGATISISVGVDDAGANSTVDWVWVELRDASDPTIVIAGKSGILQRDGDIVATDDDRITPLTFDVPANDYYIVISHRNHLAIQSANIIALSQISATIDLSNDSTSVLGGTNALINMGNGIFAMVAGDYDNNGQIQNSDINEVIKELGNSGYSNADMDMNGQIQNTDINNLMNPNAGKGQQF